MRPWTFQNRTKWQADKKDNFSCQVFFPGDIQDCCKISQRPLEKVLEVADLPDYVGTLHSSKYFCQKQQITLNIKGVCQRNP